MSRCGDWLGFGLGRAFRKGFLIEAEDDYEDA